MALMALQMQVVTLFPEMVQTVAGFGVVGRAVEQHAVSIDCQNPRDFTDDVHRTVDDRPYGGGPGMVMKYEPLAAAISAARQAVPEGSPVICLTPQGRAFDQATAERLAGGGGFVLVAGRYEGLDERLVEAETDEELSLGDFVLSGGEIAAMAVIDAVVRLLPGVLGHEASAEQDSFANGLLDCPHYTRPENVDGRDVPDVLLSGDHSRIAAWRLKQSLGRTWERRPDLLEKLELTGEQQALLAEYVKENAIK
jgi:tRNA (guanine37-N1)-methyltransferase